MKTCTCKDCGATFEYSPAVKSCPNCGSRNIKLGGGQSNNGWIKKVAIAVAIIIVILLLLKCCNGCGGPIKASLEDTTSSVNIHLSGVSKNKMKDLRVQVMCGTEEIERIGIVAKTQTAIFEKIRMLEGNCYNFRIIDKNGKPVEVRWTTSTQYCKGTSRPPIFGSPAFTVVVDREKKVYTVTIHIADTSSAEEFAIGDNWQSSAVFMNIKPGSYTIYAKNSDGVTEQPMFLKDIKDLGKPLTLAEIQAVLDAVSSGRMEPSAAQEKLADGYVNLKRVVESPDGDTLKTLNGVLQEAGLGTKFRVNGFVNDPNTNKIKPGSLDISLK